MTADAFSLSNTNSGEAASIDTVVYEAATRTLTLYADASSLTEPYSYVLSADDSVLNADSTVASISATLTPEDEVYANEGTVSAVSLCYLKDGKNIYDLTGETDFTVNITAADTSWLSSASYAYTVYADTNKTTVLARGTAYFSEDGFSVFSVPVSGYTMKSTDRISVEFE